MTATDHPITVRCSFYLREPAPEHPGQFYYVPAGPYSYGMGQNHLVTAHPPAVGDQLLLQTAAARAGLQCRVIARDWLYPAPSAVDRTPMLQIVAEPTPGLFTDEAPAPEEDEDSE